MRAAFNDLSRSELAAMSEQTFEHHVALSLAEAGVVPVDPPGERPGKLVLLDKRTYYKVAGSELLFATAADAAQAAQLAVGATKSKYTRGYSSQNYAALLCGDEVTYPGDGYHKAEISPIDLPSHEALSAAISALNDTESKMEDWQKRNKAFDEYVKKRNEIRDELWRVRSAAVEAMAAAHRVLDTRARYLDLADGDATIAERFLRRAFSGDEIAEAEDLLGLDKGALASLPEQSSGELAEIAGGAE